MTKFCGPLLVVESIENSRRFYEDVLGQKVVLDFGANITFDGGFSLQSKETWQDFIDKKEEDILHKSNNFELYFEEEDFNQYVQKLESFSNIVYVHKVKGYPWGQRVIRFYDLDGHIIEVGENMKKVVLRFLESGMTAEEVAEKTEHPIEFVKSCME